MMKDEVDQLLKNLRLRRIAEILDDQLLLAEKDGVSYQDFLLRLLRPQWHANQEKAMAYRIKKANLPELWSLETFPYHLQPDVDRKLIRSLAELDFIPRAENLVFIGGTGVGKTGLAVGILLAALQSGHRGRFISAQDLFDEMYASLADRSTRKLLGELARLDLLLIDEMGYLNLKPEQSNIFFKLMEERYGRKATIITTNLDYEEWVHFLGRQPMVEALLSRLRHHCRTIRIDGPDIRKAEREKT
jgi:DNA replication protein DnaC